MSFAYPLLLLGLIVPPVAFVAWARGVRQGQHSLRAFSRERQPGPRYVAAALFTLAACAAVVAAARPQWGDREATIPRTGAQVMIVLDVSRSMAVQDVKPDRIEAAKAALTATLRRLGGDRVGLVIFAGDSRLRFPLTTDFAAATQLIQSIETGPTLVEGGTNASSGLDIALEAFDEPSDSGRLIVLITDGDDLGADPAAVAARVRERGVDLLIAGAGTAAGGTVPVFDSRTQQTAPKLGSDGQPIVSRLNETFLRALAGASGGRYIGSDLGLLPGAIDGRLAALKRARFERESADLPVERYPLFAGIALALVVLGSVAERLPRRGVPRAALVGAGAVAALLSGACATEAYRLNDRALDAFAAGDYKRATELFLEAQAEDPADATATLNVAASLHAEERYEEASLMARRVLSSARAGERNRAYASIGHHRFAAGNLAGALDAFKQALIEDPRDVTSRRDYEVVYRLLNPPDPAATATPTPPPGGNATPEPGGANETPGGQGASATPSASASPGAGEGQGGATATATAPPGDPNQPGGGAQGSSSPQDLDRIIQRLDAEIARLVREAGDTPTTAEAIRILELLAERERAAAARDAFAGGGDPRDY